MWWAASAAKHEQAIQDRWCAGVALNTEQPTQMAIPLQVEYLSVNSWSLTCSVLEV
jgi:hypothetical protein